MADKKRIAIGSDERFPEQLLQIHEDLLEARQQLYEIELLLFEVRNKMELDPVPNWRQHGPEGG